MSKKTLAVGVTGATGAIGQAFVRLLARNADVRVLALVRRQPRLAGANLRTIFGDLFDRSALDQLASQSDVIIHLAARNPRTDVQDRKEQVSFFATNCVGAMNVARLTAQHRKRFLQVSSIAVYELSTRTAGIFDEHEQLPARPETKEWLQKARASFAEITDTWVTGTAHDPTPEVSKFLRSSSPPMNEQTYALSKFLGEKLVEIFPGTILRLSDVYGPGQESRGIIGDCLLALSRNKEVVINFGPRGLVSFIYMEDVLKALVAAATASSDMPRVINVASPTSVTETGLGECLKEMRTEIESSSLICVRRDAPVKNSVTFDARKMNQYLLDDSTTLREGLSSTLHYLRLAPEERHNYQ